VRTDNKLIENVDTFVYLGFELDCALDDKAHRTRINDRLLKAARATGQVMRDMKCASLISLRRYFISLVASQLYGALFLDSSLLEWGKAVGIFVRSALALPHSFPSSLCVALLGLRTIRSKVMAERMKFLLKLESKVKTPSFTALVHDRCHLMPMGVGLSVRLGSVLESLEILRTNDYREHYRRILQALKLNNMMERRSAILSADGRVFWSEISDDGWMPQCFINVLVKLPFEQVRLFVLFLANALRWTALSSPQPCPFCGSVFSSEHFFSCVTATFLSGREWATLITLCQHRAWQDVVEIFFAVMKRWASEARLLKPLTVLNILEFVPEHDPNPFRLNIFLKIW
jgi:hypothetical protein